MHVCVCLCVCVYVCVCVCVMNVIEAGGQVCTEYYIKASPCSDRDLCTAHWRFQKVVCF